MVTVATNFDVQQTDHFRSWLRGLRDGNARARIAARITRLRKGQFGDVKPLGNKVSELRIDYGPGYRVYFTQRGKTVCLLLCGGDKGTQYKDIAFAKEMVDEL